jgi:hypothetical protein
MSNDFYNVSGAPATGSPGSSATVRSEFASISIAFDKLPQLTGQNNRFVRINAAGSALEPAGAVPAGDVVGTTATQTLTNKTLNLSSNTLIATSAQLATALTDETGTGFAVFSASPALTGTPTAPTAGAGTNTTQIATTAHVFAERTNTATLTNKTLTTPVLSGTASGTAAGRVGYLSGALSYGTGSVQRTVVNTDEAQTLTNKTISGSSNTLSNIANASLVNSSLTVGSTSISLGATATSLAGLTDVTATTGNITTVNATTVDTTNIEVTNIKAKDGTASATIADSTGIITVSTQLNVDNLNLSGNTLSSTDTNGNIVLAPNGTGDVQLDADTVRIGDSNANATLTTNGTGDLILNTNAGTNSGSITIADAANGNITLATNGNGSTVITNAGTSNALRITQTGTGNALLVEDSANPDSTPVVVDASGNVVVGYTARVTSGNLIEAHASNTIAGSPGIAAYSWDVTTTGYPTFTLYKSQSDVVGTQGIVSSGALSVINYSFDDGVAFIRAASILAAVDGTPGTNDMPGRLVFSTTADGASVPTERVRINSSGLTTVGFSAVTGVALSTTVAAKLYSSNTTYTDGVTAASDTVTHGTIASFDNPAIAATNATVTYTNASTVYIDGAPTAGSNVTITNPYALYVAAGTVYFGGTVSAADPIVQQTDIGTAPNEIPLNQYLGALAYVDTETPALAVGTGITAGTGTICKVNGGLSGGIYRVTILVDLTGLNSGGTAGDIIGVNGTANPCYIALLPDIVVLGGRMTCLETPAGGDTDIDLYSATEGTGVEDQAISALTETQIINAGTQSVGTVTYFAADPVANTYLYLVGQSTSDATYTAGRFLIEIFGVQ